MLLTALPKALERAGRAPLQAPALALRRPLAGLRSLRRSLQGLPRAPVPTLTLPLVWHQESQSFQGT